MEIISYSDIIDHGDSLERTPMVIRCDCGRKLELWDSWANSCDCGREYNSSGQALAPRDQWGEETGECEADFINMGLD